MKTARGQEKAKREKNYHEEETKELKKKEMKGKGENDRKIER